MPASIARPYGQLFLPGLGLVPSATAELQAYEALPASDNVRAQALAKHILESDLSAVGPMKKNQKIAREDIVGAINVRPIVPPALKKPEGVADLRRIASDDTLRPALTGVFLNVKKLCMVATNGHMLVSIPDASLTGNNRIVTIKTGALIDERYPDYENIIPIGRKLIAPVTNLTALRAQLTGLVKAGRVVDFPDPAVRAEIIYGTYHYYFNPAMLLDVVTVLQKTGSTTLNFEFDDTPGRALVLRDAQNPEKLGILMPVMNASLEGGKSSLGQSETIPFCNVLKLEAAGVSQRSDKYDSSGRTQADRDKQVASEKKPTKAADIKPEKPAKAKKPAGIKFVQVEGDQFMTEDKRWSYTDPNGSHHPHNKFEVAIHNGKTFIIVELAETEQKAKDFIAKHFKKTYKQFSELKVDARGDKAEKPKISTKTEKPTKAGRTKKAKPADTRTEVSHFDAETMFFRQFVALTEKPVTLTQVRNLHRKLEKAIAMRKVRKASPNAALLDRVANIVASAYEKMTKGNIATVKKLELPTEAVAQARAIALGSKVSNAVNLLSRFINLQGQMPEKKAVDALLKSLEKEHAEHPSSSYALAIGAAVATLRDWQPGRAVGISEQQLGRLGQLSGLGCACQDAAKQGATETSRDWHQRVAKKPAARKTLGNVDASFTVIGEKDHRQASGNVMHLPGDLGRFLGNIEDHEYALAIRGEKGAGKSRFLYQLKNLFAGQGKRVGSFSLEISKNSDVVTRYRDAYIEPANRPRVLIASEAANLDTIRQAAKAFDVVAIDSWGKIPGVQPGDFDKIRKEFPNTIFLVIFQSTVAGGSRGGSSSEYDASAVCQVNLPGVAVMEKNRYATGAADELKYLVNEQRLATAADLIKPAA